jgi:hypothetical protein
MITTGLLKEAWDKAYDKWVVHNDWTAKQVEEKDYTMMRTMIMQKRKGLRRRKTIVQGHTKTKRDYG